MKVYLKDKEYDPLRGMIVAAIKVSGGCMPAKVPEVMQEAQRLRDKSGRYPDKIIEDELTKLRKQNIIKYDPKVHKWMYVGHE